MFSSLLSFITLHMYTETNLASESYFSFKCLSNRNEKKKKTLTGTTVHTSYCTTGFIQQDQQLINTLIPCHMILGFCLTLKLYCIGKILPHIQMQCWICIFLMHTLLVSCLKLLSLLRKLLICQDTSKCIDYAGKRKSCMTATYLLKQI